MCRIVDVLIWKMDFFHVILIHSGFFILQFYFSCYSSTVKQIWIQMHSTQDYTPFIPFDWYEYIPAEHEKGFFRPSPFSVMVIIIIKYKRDPIVWFSGIESHRSVLFTVVILRRASRSYLFLILFFYIYICSVCHNKGLNRPSQQ